MIVSNKKKIMFVSFLRCNSSSVAEQLGTCSGKNEIFVFDNGTGRRWLWVQPLYIWRTTKCGEEIHDKGYASRGIWLRQGPGKLF